MKAIRQAILPLMLISLVAAVIALPVQAQYGGGGGGGGGGFTPFSPLPTFPPSSPTPTSTVTPTPTSTVTPSPAPTGTPGVVTGALQVSSTVVFPGDVITVGGSGFAPNVDVVIILGAFSVTLGSLRSDAGGSISGPVVIPIDTIPGEYLLRAEGLNADRVNLRRLTANLTVLGRAGTGVGTGADGAGTGVGAGVSRRGAAGTIAQTGVDALPWLVAGVAAIGLGLALVLTARKRRAG